MMNVDIPWKRLFYTITHKKVQIVMGYARSSQLSFICLRLLLG